jgi:hypothetical protein
MRYLPENIRVAVRITLLGLLLTAQSLAFAHELGHLSSGDSTVCAACSISSGEDTPAVVSHIAPDSVPVIVSHKARPNSVNTTASANPLTARDPPPVF